MNFNYSQFHSARLSLRMALYCLASRVLFLLLGQEGAANPQQEYLQKEHLNYHDAALQSHFTLPKMRK